MNERFKLHYEILKKMDSETLNMFNGELEKKGYLDRFKRGICKNKKIRPIDVPSWVRSCVVKFMPWWSHENFESNTWPDLPNLD